MLGADGLNEFDTMELAETDVHDLLDMHFLFLGVLIVEPRPWLLKPHDARAVAGKGAGRPGAAETQQFAFLNLQALSVCRVLVLL